MFSPHDLHLNPSAAGLTSGSSGDRKGTDADPQEQAVYWTLSHTELSPSLVLQRRVHSILLHTNTHTHGKHTTTGLTSHYCGSNRLLKPGRLEIGSAYPRRLVSPVGAGLAGHGTQRAGHTASAHTRASLPQQKCVADVSESITDKTGSDFLSPSYCTGWGGGSETWRHDRVTMTVWGAVVRAHVPRPWVFTCTVTWATLSRPQPLREGGSGGRRPSRRNSTQDTSHLLTLLYCEIMASDEEKNPNRDNL